MNCIRDTYDNNFKRISWLDIFKGLGIIFVLIGHIYLNEYIHNWIYSFHIPLFFMAAGHTYKTKPITQDINHRFKTIVIPYFSFGILILIYWQFFERHFRESNMSFWDSFLGLFSGEYRYLDFNVHLWFLPCFFMTVVLFNILVNINIFYMHGNEFIYSNPTTQIIMKYYRLAYLVSFVLSLGYAISSSIGYSLPALPWGLEKIVIYIGFYALGNVLSIYHLDAKVRLMSKNLTIVVAIVLLIISFILSIFRLTTGFMWFVTAIVGIGAIGIISIVINENRFLQYIGRISLVVLCVHGPIYRVIIKLLSIVAKNSTDVIRRDYILSMIVVILTLGICSVIYEILNYLAPWMVGKKVSTKLTK